MAVSFLYDGVGSLTLILKGNTHIVHRTNPVFQALKSKLKKGTEDEIIKLLASTTSNFMVEAANAKVEVRDDRVYYNGVEMSNSLTQRIRDYILEDLPYDPLMKFLKNVMMNPNENSRKELFDFLVHANLPITEDGHFLAYKAVNGNFTDNRTGKISNKVGQTVRMKREEVDNNCGVACGSGLHVGTIEYARDFRKYCSDGGHLMLVKVHPANAVSVPRDSSCQKLRTCEYTVVGIYTEDLTRKLYDNSLTPVGSIPVRDFNEYEDVDDEDDWEEDEEWHSDWDDEDEEEDEDDTWADDEEDDDYLEDEVESFNDEDEEKIEVEDKDVEVKNYRHNLRGKGGRFVKKKGSANSKNKKGK